MHILPFFIRITGFYHFLRNFTNTSINFLVDVICEFFEDLDAFALSVKDSNLKMVSNTRDLRKFYIPSSAFIKTDTSNVALLF